MNQATPQHIDRELKASGLSTWMLSHGVTSMRTEEIASLLSIPFEQVRTRLAAQRRVGAIVSPARGLWVPVPPERAAWGAPEPGAYINDMMAFLGCSYYVGWLSAAFLHGAGHQAPQEFQVASSKHISDREIGRSKLRFLTRGRIDQIPATRMVSGSSFVRVSTVGATMLDVAADPDISGGLDNAATVIAELAWENDDFMGDILTAAPAHSAAAVRRLGWILEHVAEIDGLDDLARASAEKGASPSYLSPNAPRGGSLDVRWNIFVNKEVDPDI